MKLPVSVTVNGRGRELLVDTRQTLASLVRDTLGLTGTHIGCKTANCGVCTVELDGRPAELPLHLPRSGGKHHVTVTAAGGTLTVRRQVVVIGVAFAVTTFFNRFRMPTSTIQILVFSIVGVSLATGIGVNWDAIGHLVIVWAVAPVAAIFLGYLLTLGLGHLRLGERIGTVLVAMGAVAAFAMGANDVSNASGALVGTGTFSPLEAGAVGGAAIALGVLTWGKPLLRRVAFEIVEVDRAMATAAQLVQAAVVLAAVAFGFFTSMNQALVGAMAGSGFARGRETVHLATLFSILQGWVLGPALSIAAGYVFGLLVR